MESNTSLDTSGESRLEHTDMSVEVEVLSTQTIIPSTPTPDHRRRFALSLFDQLSPLLHIPFIFYYPRRDPRSSVDILERLRSSLPVVLTRFYPLAGRLKDNLSIECHDQGVEFLETKVNRKLSEVLTRPNPKLLRMLLPMQVESSSTGHLLVVQVNVFECGGVAVGICISHKVADASAMSTFIKSWADVVADASDVDPALQLNASSLIPPSSHLRTPVEVEFHKAETVMKRYVFDSSSLAALVGEITCDCKDDGIRPTRLEALSSLLWKCLIVTSRRIRGHNRRSIFSHVVNLRGRTPPFPKDGVIFGNLLGGFMAEITEVEEDIDMIETAKRLRLAKEDYLDRFAKQEMSGENLREAFTRDAGVFFDLLMNPEVEFYNCTSWCRFPLYAADFGWGNPAWVSVVSAEFKDAILMIDGREGGGIEVWLSLEMNHMVELEKEEDFLRFASPNPTIAL